MIILGINGSVSAWIMEGPKRLQFETVGPTETKPKKGPTPKTFRFDLDLSDSTDTVCPEFFYSDLVKPSSVSHHLVCAYQHAIVFLFII